MKKKKLPSIKKNIENFINEEEGRISKKDALILGMSVVTFGLSLEGVASAHYSYFTDTTGNGLHYSSSAENPPVNYHTSSFSNTGGRGMHSSTTACHSSHANHANHVSHSVHSSCHNSCHGSHGSHSSSSSSCHGSCTTL